MKLSRPRGPAYRVETARTRLRCFAPSDVTMLSRAIAESLEHLRPWMTWTVHEPLSFGQRLESLRTRRGHFDLGSDYAYGIFDKSESRILGCAGLYLRGEVDEREVGYWIHVDHLRQGLASEVVAALVKIGFEVEDLESVDIRIDPNNLRSARLAEKLGFVGPVLDPLSFPMPDGSKRDTHVFSLSRVQYAGSPLREQPLEAYDVLDARVL